MDWVELLAGAAIGVISAALFEDGLRRKMQELVSGFRFSRKERGQPSVFAGGQFVLDSLVVPVEIFDGDGTRVIDRKNVRVEVDPVMVDLPDELAEWRTEIAEQQTKSPRRQFWNGLRYAVVGIEHSRTAEREEPEIYIRLRHADYFTFLTVQQHDRRFADGTTIKQRYIDGRALDQIPDFIFPSFGINVVVTTADQFVIVTHRSEQLGSGANEWNVSANEGLSRDLDATGTHPPDLYQVAERGLTEELALEYGEYDLSMLGIALERQRYQWGAFFVAKLRSLSAKELQDRHARGIQDRWEHRSLEYVPFRPDSLLDYLLRPARIDRWAPFAPVAFWLALTNTFGRPRVERAVRHLSEPKRQARKEQITAR